MEEDMNNKCFICGLGRYVFEKDADGFLPHIDNEHCLWNYLYYIYYIKNKDQTELNGVESYVIDNIKNHEINWFPLMKAMSVGNKEEGEFAEQVNEKLELMQAHI